jgi:predicted ferric reductase
MMVSAMENTMTRKLIKQLNFHYCLKKSKPSLFLHLFSQNKKQHTMRRGGRGRETEEEGKEKE